MAGTAGSSRGIELPSFTIDHFKLGGIVNREVEFVTIQLPPGTAIDGVIGVNFLRDYRTTFDFIDGWIELAERK